MWFLGCIGGDSRSVGIKLVMMVVVVVAAVVLVATMAVVVHIRNVVAVQE